MGAARRREANVDVFVDVATQRDYLDPSGACRVLNASRITPNIKHLMAYARWAKIPTISCVEARRPADVRGLPSRECVVGTLGQRKLSCTLLPQRKFIDSDNCLCVALDVLKRHQQVILVKESRDPFSNPKLDRLLTEMPARRFVLFGVGLETSIRLLALGSLLRHRQVAVVRDACGWWNEEDGDMALRQLAAKGCDVVRTHELVQTGLASTRRKGHYRRYRSRSVA